MKALKITISWALVLCVMVMIFIFSSQTAENSSDVSGGLLSLLYNLISRIFGVPCLATEKSVFSYHNLFRKFAHLCIYGLLGLLFSNALLQSGVKKMTKVALFALLFSFVYAITDEYHQVFVPGRSGEVRDVLIDTSGAVLGTLIFVAFCVIRRKIWILKKQ